MEKAVLEESKNIIKDQTIEQLQQKLEAYGNIDLEKYRTMAIDLRKSNKQLEAALRAYEIANQLAIARLEDIQLKDKYSSASIARKNFWREAPLSPI